MPRITDKIVKTGFQSSLKTKSNQINSFLLYFTEEYLNKHFLRDQYSDDKSFDCISLSVPHEDIQIQL